MLSLPAPQDGSASEGGWGILSSIHSTARPSMPGRARSDIVHIPGECTANRAGVRGAANVEYSLSVGIRPVAIIEPARRATSRLNRHGKEIDILTIRTTCIREVSHSHVRILQRHRCRLVRLNIIEGQVTLSGLSSPAESHHPLLAPKGIFEVHESECPRGDLAVRGGQCIGRAVDIASRYRFATRRQSAC